MEKELVYLVSLTLQRWLQAGTVLASMAGLGYGSMVLTNLGLGGIDGKLTPAAPKLPVAVAGEDGGRRPKAKRKFLKGIASWYGSVWEGRVTASGEVFRQSAMTACHPSLPFGTLVRVINLRNHRSVVVRINDRGLAGTGRLIDLTSAAAQKIGMIEAGLAPVRLEVLGVAAAHG